MKFTVNDTTAYGIYNGFSQFDQDLKSMISDEISGLLKEYFFDPFDKFELTDSIRNSINKDVSFRKVAMQYYRPHPIDDKWSEEVKALVSAQIKAKTADGVCDVPPSIVSDWVHKHTVQRVDQYVKDSIKQCRKVIQLAERQESVPSRDEANKQMDAYNDIHNQGGYGYVPHIYCVEEYNHANDILSFMLLYSSLESRIQSASDRAEKSLNTSSVKRLSFHDDIGYTEFEVSLQWYNNQPKKDDVANLFHKACADDSSGFKDVTGKYYDGSQR